MNVILTRLTICELNNHHRDQYRSELINQIAKAHQKAGRFDKVKFPPTALGPIRSYRTKARKIFYDNTFPYERGSWAALPTKNFMRFRELMEPQIDGFRKSVQDFLVSYDAHIRAAEIYLGEMFDLETYPPVDDIKDAFSIDLEFTPLPENNFWAELPADALSKLQQEVERKNNERLKATTNDLANRIYTAVKGIHERLHKGLKHAKSGVLTEVNTLIETIPLLNITDDPRIDELHTKLHLLFNQIEMPELKKDATLQDVMKSQTGDMMKQINQWGLL